MDRMRPPFCALALVSAFPALSQPRAEPFNIEITIAHQSAPLTGHLILCIAKESKEEPRFQISETYDSAQAFGVDVEDLAPGKPIVIDAAKVGYPLEHFSDLQPGETFVQGVFNIYEPFHLASGAVLELPPDRGEGQQWNSKPGNPYSEATEGSISIPGARVPSASHLTRSYLQSLPISSSRFSRAIRRLASRLLARRPGRRSETCL